MIDGHHGIHDIFFGGERGGMVFFLFFFPFLNVLVEYFWHGMFCRGFFFSKSGGPDFPTTKSCQTCRTAVSET